MITRFIKIVVLLPFLAFGIFLLTTALTRPTPTPTPTPVPTLEPVNGATLSREVNNWRVEKGLNSLPEEESLCRFAEQRAEEIKTDWSHSTFDNLRCTTINFQSCGENLLRGYPTPKEALAAWVESPGHLENLQRLWSAMCIKCSGIYCAQEFGL